MNQTPAQPLDAFQRFCDTMRALLAVPKKEIDEQAAKWTRRKNKKAAHGRIVPLG